MGFVYETGRAEGLTHRQKVQDVARKAHGEVCEFLLAHIPDPFPAYAG